MVNIVKFSSAAEKVQSLTGTVRSKSIGDCRGGNTKNDEIKFFFFQFFFFETLNRNLEKSVFGETS
jgi:hypothetical protein